MSHRIPCCCRFLLAVALAGGGAQALAQLRLPSLPAPIPALPTTPQLPLRPAEALAASLAPADLEGLRRSNIERLLRAHPRALARDPAGEPVIRDELLAVPSSPAMRDAVLAAGFILLREESLDGLDEAWWVLRPERDPAPRALARLRALDPAGRYDYHHVYTGSGESGPVRADSVAPAPLPSSSASAAALSGKGLRIGLVDAGLDWSHPAFHDVSVRLQECVDALPHPSPHGTAVASLLVGHLGAFRGVQPEATLFAADAYCDAPTGGSVDAIARGLAWLVRERVPVINISLVGPPNAILERVVAAVVARGHLVVAPVGNDGPAAAPLYPAAWPGVVGVTATDARRRLLAEAGRGAHVMFAAPGADMAAAASRDPRFVPVRGTSFAAPIVAGLLAARLSEPDRSRAQAALATLAASAIDLGPPGRDPSFGFGLVGDALRVDPRLLQLAAAR